MKRRIPAFDLLRIVAACGIVAVHVCYSFPREGFLRAGQQLGGTFNAVFLLLSAMLYGLRKDEGRGESVFRFLGRRILRLGIPLWTFLIVFFATLFIFTDIRPAPAAILAEFAFLGWPIKIAGIGHLWFMTLILMCYTALPVFSRFPAVRNAAWKEAGLGVAAVCTAVWLDRRGFPAAQAPLYLFAFEWTWNHAEEILAFSMTATKSLATFAELATGTITLQVICAFAFQSGLWSRSHTGAYVLGLVSGLSWIALAAAASNAISFGSTSEGALSRGGRLCLGIYLVHNPFTRSPFPLHSWIPLPNFAVRWAAVLAVSIAAATLLELVSERIIGACVGRPRPHGRTSPST